MLSPPSFLAARPLRSTFPSQAESLPKGYGQQLVYIEHGSGREIRLDVEDFSPLGFDALAERLGRLGQPLSFPLTVRGVITASGVEGVEVGKTVTANAVLENSMASTTIMLREGGWLPPGLCLQQDVLIVDQNALASIRNRLLGRNQRNGRDSDFLDLLRHGSHQFSPLIFMLEGKSRGRPADTAELEQIYDRFQARLTEALPTARIPASRADAVRGVLGLRSDLAPSAARNQRFLLAAAPHLVPETSRKAREALWWQLAQMAADHGVRRSSLVFLTVLSATAARGSMNPARKLLKISRQYDKHDAHNALSDLQALEVLNYAISHFPQERMTLLTQDRSLSMLWAGFRAYGHHAEGRKVRYSVSVARLLFAALSEQEFDELTDFLQANSARSTDPQKAASDV